ncbi:interleukin-36 receptor antagonist protein [Protobothrops mucrosquamatus]|uniref:interleukin-36 receptor antagonist protein n=1 Tax=Protobothrops mucrosquamatus TaxID=103944 RepID=UPI000775AAC1|nr:interleukin-36 receptor antagonist protein [Protobothrops mucrosquamatus]
MEPQKKTVDEELKELFHAFKDKEALNKPWDFRTWDIEQKYFFFEKNQLIAAPLDFRSSVQLMAVVPNNNLEIRKRPIFLGLTDKRLVLAGQLSVNDEPQLVILEDDIMDLYRSTNESKNYSFYVVTKCSRMTCCFESVAFPGWFLCTSVQPNMPLGLCKAGDPKIILFHFLNVSSTPKLLQ